MLSKYTLLVPVVLALSGCINPRDYETTPVNINTAKGVVTCQLYSTDQVLWDRAISIPKTMTVKEADSACKTEGRRIIEES